MITAAEIDNLVKKTRTRKERNNPEEVKRNYSTMVLTVAQQVLKFKSRQLLNYHIRTKPEVKRFVDRLQKAYDKGTFTKVLINHFITIDRKADAV